MGNDVKKPAAALLRQPDMFPEVQDAKLSSVKEAADFWMRQYPDTARIGLEEFDELFSCVFKDPEAVYPLFGKRTAVVLDTFCIVALLADESVDAKLRFIFYLFAEDFAADCKMALCRAFLGVMGGVSCLFNCKVPIRDTVLDYVVAAVQKLVDLNSSASRTRIDQKDFPMELDEFIQLVQEDRYISSYTDAVLSMCRTRQYITDAMLTVNRHVQESKLMSGIEEDAKARKKSRHPLWRYTILDLFEQSWLQPLPQMDTHDTVLTVLEHCVLSGKNAVPVYSRTPIDTRKAHTAAATGRSMEMSQAIAAIMRHAGGGATADEDEKQDEHPFQLFDLVDIHTFVYWLAASAPASVVNSRHLEKANEGMSVYAVRKPRRRAKGLTSGSKMGSGVLGAGASSSAKIRRMSTLPIQDQWQEAGVLFATTQIKTACVEEQSIMSSNNKVESPSSKLSGAGTPINIMNAGPGLMSMSSFMEVPHEVRYTQANVFQTDQYMYNVIEQVAKGFRLIPIASSRLKPYTVTQIVSTKQVVSFLRLYATELLGKLAVKPIGRSGLMRKAPSIPREANFGTAIVALSESKFECIPVTDDQMRFCSRIDASSVQHFWWTWKLNLIRRTGTTATLEALQHEYSKNNVLIPSGSGLNFSYFSSLLSPLNQCGELGIHLNDFDEVMKAALKAGFSSNYVAARKHMRAHGADSDSDEDEDDDEFDDCMSKAGDKDSDTDSDTRSVTSSTSTKSVSLSSVRGSSKNLGLRKGSKAGIKQPKLSAAAKRRIEEEEKKKKQQELEEAIKIQEKIEAIKISSFQAWLQDMGVVLIDDSIQVALESMHQFNTSQAFVVNARGELIGMITLQDIAKTMLSEENYSQTTVYQQLIDGEL